MKKLLLLQSINLLKVTLETVGTEISVYYSILI